MSAHHISYRTIIHFKSRDSTPPHFSIPHFISHHNSPQITWLHHVSAHHFTCPHSTMHIATFKYKIYITLPTAHIPYHTTHPTLHFDHHSACLIGRQTIPHHSVLLPQPHFTSCISTPPHSPCTMPFHIASHHFTPDVARHHSVTPLMSHIFYIAPYQSTSQPQGE